MIDDKRIVIDSTVVKPREARSLRRVVGSASAVQVQRSRVQKPCLSEVRSPGPSTLTQKQCAGERKSVEKPTHAQSICIPQKPCVRSPAIDFGPLAQIAADSRVTDIAVTGDGAVWADRGNGMRRVVTQIPLRSPQHVRELAVRLCAQFHCRLDDARPIADAGAPDGTRIHAVIAPIVPQGASISVRFADTVTPNLMTLASMGLCPSAWVPMLTMLVKERANVLITGGTGAGKTTLLKALLACVDCNERIITVEEVRELASAVNPHMVSMVARPANTEGAGAVGLPDLVKATLRMRPDRVVVGECRGDEIVDLLRAINSGHRGTITTLHADSVARVPARLISLGLLAGVQPDALAMLAAGAFDVVLHVERVRGRRMITQIGMLTYDQGRLQGREVLRWNGSGIGIAGAAWGDFAHRWATVAA